MFNKTTQTRHTEQSEHKHTPTSDTLEQAHTEKYTKEWELMRGGHKTK